MKKKEILFKRFGLFVLTFMVLFMSYDVATSATVQDFYKGKTLTFLVPNSPGGGYDLYARIMAPSIGKIIGSPVVVLNKPGASGLIGANYMYNTAKPDGLTIGICQPFTLIMDELLDNRGVKYDSKKFTWLGRAGFSEFAFAVGKDSPYRNIDEIKKAREFKIGIDDRTSMQSPGVVAFCMSAGLENARVVVGYKGSSEVRVAILKGEVNGAVQGVAVMWDLIKSGDLTPVVITGKERSKNLPGVPTIYAINPNMPPETRKWVDRLVALQVLGRGLNAPPGVPKDRADFLTAVLHKALTDPEVVNRLAKVREDIEYLAPAEYMELLFSMKLTPEEKARFKHLLLEKY